MANVGGAYLSTSIIQGLSSMMTLFTVSYKFKIKRDIKKNKQWGAKTSFFFTNMAHKNCVYFLSMIININMVWDEGGNKTF